MGADRSSGQIEAAIDHEAPFRIPGLLFAFRLRRGAPVVVLRQIAIWVGLEEGEMLGGCKTVDRPVPLVLILRIADGRTFVSEIGHGVIALESNTRLDSLRNCAPPEKNRRGKA